MLALVVIIAIAAASSPKPADPKKDVAITDCKANVLNLPQANGTIVNRSSKPSDYLIEVEFVTAGVRIGEGVTAANRVAPGQTAAWEAIGTGDGGAGMECKLLKVTRHASV